MIHIADQLVETGKFVPFALRSSRWNLLTCTRGIFLYFPQIIINIEKQASEADAKCNDILERINFMVSHLENIRLFEATKSVMQEYRRFSRIARKTGETEIGMNLDSLAGNLSWKVYACGHQLLEGLRIQSASCLAGRRSRGKDRGMYKIRPMPRLWWGYWNPSYIIRVKFPKVPEVVLEDGLVDDFVSVIGEENGAFSMRMVSDHLIKWYRRGLLLVHNLL